MHAICDNTSRRRRGFTLIELMFVAAIIIILAAIVLPMAGKAVKESRINSTKSTIIVLHRAVLMYADEYNSTYPNSSNTDGGDLLPADSSGTRPYYGAQWLVECLTGYVASPSDATPIDMINKDGQEGPGFRQRVNGTLHGPYNGAEKVPTVQVAAAANSGKRPMFKDAFGSPILYFRLNGGTYNPADNSVDVTSQPQVPADYFTNKDKDKQTRWDTPYDQLFRTDAYKSDLGTDFILTSPGPNKIWYDPTSPDHDNPKGTYYHFDDITNWTFNTR